MTINNNTSTHAYENEKHDRYYGKDAVIKFALEGGYNKGTDLTTDGLKEAEAYEAGTATEEEIYLAKVNNDGEVLNSTNPFKITFKYDPDAPQCSEIKFGEENKVVTDLATTITFGIYKNKNIEAKLYFLMNYQEYRDGLILWPTQKKMFDLMSCLHLMTMLRN